jgi:hypoxanthine phosphoribosyltransferase
MKNVRLHDRNFQIFIPKEVIQQRVEAMGHAIATDYVAKMPVFLGILNGAFLFAADLARACENINCEWHFVKLASYEGMHSTGEVAVKIGFELEKLRGRHVVLVEDIVDTGRTLAEFMKQVNAAEPASVALATAFLKPDALQFPLEIDYCGFEIPNAFVVGYGLDYDGLGRNLSDLYQLSE